MATMPCDATEATLMQTQDPGTWILRSRNPRLKISEPESLILKHESRVLGCLHTRARHAACCVAHL